MDAEGWVDTEVAELGELRSIKTLHLQDHKPVRFLFVWFMVLLGLLVFFFNLGGTGDQIENLDVNHLLQSELSPSSGIASYGFLRTAKQLDTILWYSV